MPRPKTNDAPQSVDAEDVNSAPASDALDQDNSDDPESVSEPNNQNTADVSTPQDASIAESPASESAQDISEIDESDSNTAADKPTASQTASVADSVADSAGETADEPLLGEDAAMQKVADEVTEALDSIEDSLSSLDNPSQAKPAKANPSDAISSDADSAEAGVDANATKADEQPA